MLKDVLTLPGGEPKNLEEFHSALAANLDALDADPELRGKLGKERLGNPQMLGSRVVSPDDWVEDMKNGALAKADKWLKKSLRPKKDPKTAALKAKGKYKQRMQESLDNDDWEAGIKAVDETLRNATIEKVGTAGYRAGINAKADKAKAKIQKLQPLVTMLAETLDKLPTDTPEQRGQKMIAARDGMLEIKKRMRAA